MNTAEILRKLIQGSEGIKWSNEETRIGWKSTDVFEEESGATPVCHWSGIICNDTNDQKLITEIDLSDTTLIGTIPSELGLLTTLRKLDLSVNLLRGAIPYSVAALPNLEVLNLSENQLLDVFPKFQSKVLRSLNLSYNHLMGTLHGDLGVSYPDMTDLDLMENQLTGYIPETIGGMSSLVGISLSGNAFSGTISHDIGNIASLKYLYLDNNKLVGLIPPSIARDDSILEELWLQSNFLSGTIPAQLSALTQLASFFVDGNKFTGTMPHDLCSEGLNANFYQDVSENIERDYCDSIACPVGTYSMKGIFPCFSCSENSSYDTTSASNVSATSSSNTYNPYLGRSGSACFDVNQRDILMKFFQETGGHSSWKDEENWDVEDSFLCTFTGITCDVNYHVIAIELPNEGLKGRIPQELGFLRYLQRLNLSGNELTGFLPSDLRFAPLVFLDVSGNKLRGVVPPMLCLKAGINDNGNDGDYNCDHLACPAGTANSNTGRRSVDGSSSGKCSPCPINNVNSADLFLASKTCPTPSSNEENSSTFSKKDGDHSENNAITGFLLFAVLISAVASIVYFQKDRKISENHNRRNKKNKTQKKRNSFGLLDEQNRFVNLQPRRTSMPLINSHHDPEEDITTQTHSSNEDASSGSFHRDESGDSHNSANIKKPLKKKHKRRDSINCIEQQQQLALPKQNTTKYYSETSLGSGYCSQDGSATTGHGSAGSGSTGDKEVVWLDVPKLT